MPTEKKLPLQKLALAIIPPKQLKEVGVFHCVLQKIKRAFSVSTLPPTNFIMMPTYLKLYYTCLQISNLLYGEAKRSFKKNDEDRS